ncbi:hypothetical protein [Williamsia sterculiae]|uniref:Uncharacterized protein n=1 Tax=Williamsia sterculiae TaxID=1344003 RepID=A0A1N7GPE4_9NOCA|nr:hypothetical protein [Williamsia sterculiae]SIS14400.1 hypothetical protein SAMN05445060_2956 [Williamsia sterculiae]
MAREIDPARRRANRDVVRQNPGMVAFAVSPAILVFAGVWWALGFWIAVIAAVAVGGATAYYFLRR